VAIARRNSQANQDLFSTYQYEDYDVGSLGYISHSVESYRNLSFCEYTKDETSKSLLASDSITDGNLIVETYQNICGTLSPGAHSGSYNGQDAHNDLLIVNNYAVRRLTPMECERLMGFPDNWTALGQDGKTISDTQRYKAIGNSVAIPCVLYVLNGCLEVFNRCAETSSHLEGING